jgi:hypothetical protein
MRRQHDAVIRQRQWVTGGGGGGAKAAVVACLPRLQRRDLPVPVMTMIDHEKADM